MTRAAWRNQPIYAWLIALYPILFLYSQNVGDVRVDQVRIAALISLIAASLIVTLLWLITRQIHLAGALAALIALVFFSYGHVFNLIAASDRPRVQLLLNGAYLLIGATTIVLLTRRRSLVARGSLLAAPYLNLITAALLIMTLPPILTNAYRAMMQTQAVATRASAEHLPDSPTHPDIYYILLDGYSSDAFWQHTVGIDNSAFTEALADRGFYVASRSHTPYAITLPAKFSTLNMRYLTDDDILAAWRARTRVEYVQRGISDSEVSRKLQSLGYTYVYMLSGFDIPSQTADQNVDFFSAGPVYFQADTRHSAMSYYQLQFYPLLLRTTLLRVLAQRVAENAALDPARPYDLREPLRALAIWDEAEAVPEREEATFTVIHIIKPHEPIAFDAQGNIVKPYATYETATHAEVHARFQAQLEFVNTRTLQMIDTLIAQSDVPPIILLQGDHGSIYGDPRAEDRRSTNFGILNAYLFPDRDCDGLTPDIIPINSFRVLFNCYFEGDYPLLESHHYAVTDYSTMFHFEEIDIDAWAAEHEGR